MIIFESPTETYKNASLLLALAACTGFQNIFSELQNHFCESLLWF